MVQSIKFELEAFTDEFEGELEKRKIFGVPITREVSIPLICCCGILTLIISIALGAALGKEEDKFMKSYSTDERVMGLKELLEPLVGEAIGQDGTSANQALLWLAHHDPAELPLDSHLDYLTQRFVLAELYMATDGENWDQTTTTQVKWLSYRPECEWNVEEVDADEDAGNGDYGAWCDDDGGKYITWLELNHMNLNGTIPNSLGLLTHLTFLSLHENVLKGTIPRSFQLLQQLTALDLHTNEITGWIPREVHTLHKLEKIELQHNKMKGGFDGIHQMDKIKYMDFSHNKHEGNLKFFKKMADMKGLEYFDISNNGIGGKIETYIGALTNLKTLALSSNKITGRIPTHVGAMSSLEHLHLDHNELTGSLPTQLGKLSDLISLNCFDNSLSRNLPSQVFQISTLNHLLLDVNGFDGRIPKTVAEATNLHVLRLGTYNRMYEETDRVFFAERQIQ